MKKYDKYKPTYIDWIGEIPEHWDFSRMKYEVKYEKGKNPKEQTFEEIGKPYLSMEYLRGNPKQIFYVEDFENYLNVKENEILLLWDGSNAGEFIRSKEGVLSSTTAVLSINSINQNYAWYFFKTFEIQLKNGTIGMGIPHVNGEDFKNQYFIIPPKSEQTAIANYLDEKTAQIDTLISNKQKLIELLKEERTAIINEAVSGKGKNWERKKLKYVANVNSPKKHYDFDKDSDVEVVFLPMEKVSENGMINQEAKKKIKEVSTGFTYFERGDVIFAKITPCFENGKGALLENLESDFGFGSTEFHTLRASNKITIEYLFYLTKTDKFMQVGKAFMTGSAGQKRVPSSFVEDFLIDLPTIVEQKKIIELIKTETQRIDSTINKIEKEIELMQEYRTALISEVVTGKIKVA